MRRIKVMADYGCWPLWEDGPAVGNIDPETLPISVPLMEQLAAWAAEFDEGLNWDDPAASPWVPDFDRFEADGRDLARRLAIELGESVIVRYWRDSSHASPASASEGPDGVPG